VSARASAKSQSSHPGIRVSNGNKVWPNHRVEMNILITTLKLLLGSIFLLSLFYKKSRKRKAIIFILSHFQYIYFNIF
jgi:hypothetical protein